MTETTKDVIKKIAEKEITRAAEIELALSDANKAIYRSQASIELNLDRTKSLIEEIDKTFATAQKLKAEFKSASEISEAVRSLNAAKQGVVEAIKSDPKLLQSILSNVAIPKGIVTAYSAVAAETNCPPGWINYELATGRFIVGAGVSQNKDQNGVDLTDRQIGETAGEERHQLTMAEIPPYDHAVYRHAAAPYTGDGPFTAGSGSEDLGFKVNDNWKTGVTGGGAPHNTMPPFVALYYCIKE